MLEGVAFGLRDSLELLRGLGVGPRSAASRAEAQESDLWLRIVASVLQLPLERMETDEGSAFGAALLAGIARGHSPTRAKRFPVAFAFGRASTPCGTTTSSTGASAPCTPPWPGSDIS